MAGLVGMLAAGALQVAAGQMASFVGDRIIVRRRLVEDIEYLTETTRSIQSVLEDAERRSLEDMATQLWLERLAQASYNISDMFDEFEVSATTGKFALRKLKILNPCLTHASEVRMASKLKKVRESLDRIADERHKYSTRMTSSSSSDQLIMHMDQEKRHLIMHMDQEVYQILALLSRASTSSDFIALPIYGIGGIGKTTLARIIFNGTYFEGYKKAWVYVSQTFDLKRIKEAVRSQIQLNQGQLANTQEEGESAPKGILIVLDDLWEKNDFKLDDMKYFLKQVGNGHKLHVIITTRDASIAEKVQTIEAHKKQTLPDDVCWHIIKWRAGFEHKADKERLRVIGHEIAKKCGGVALAARAIGYILRSKDFNGWVSVNDSCIWKDSSAESSSPYESLLSSLKLSYICMPQHLRPCFAYCAIFPKGYKMSKDELIYQWAALGFIKPSDEFSIWHHGEDYIEQLLEMSFLSWSRSTDDWELHKGVTLFTMHDLVHDLARIVMAYEVLDASQQSRIGGSECRYVLLADCSKPFNTFVTHPDKIRALRFLGSGETRCCHAGFSTASHAGFSTAKYLRILDLGESSIKELPSSIGQLRLLRYLNAQGITNRGIPRCLTKLSKLLYLNLAGACDLLELPELIGEMEGLMYLDLSKCERIEMLPKSFVELENLIHLDLSHCLQMKATPGALRSLTKVEYLNLSHCSWLPINELQEVIGKLSDKLRYLNLSNCLGAFSSCFVDNSDDIGNLFDKISVLSNLEHLDLSYNSTIVTLPDSFCSLKKLRVMDLTSCRNLRKLPQNMECMDSLRILIMNGCIFLDESTLLANENVIPLPNFVVHKFRSNLIQLKDVNPRELMIRCLENVKSVEDGWGIKLWEKESLINLTLDWTREAMGFVEDMELLGVLVPPSTLKSFFLQGYNSVSFPAWLAGIDMYLPILAKVGLEGLPQCSSLPPLGQLPNLEYLSLQAMPNITKIDRGFCGNGTMKAFPQLKVLRILDMENLEDWSTTYSCGEACADEFMFPNLERLTLAWCPKLRVGPCPPRVRDTWSIQNCDRVLLQGVENSPHHTICSTSTAPVGILQVVSCKEPMDQWKLLYHLHGLHGLRIESCNDLSSSPEIIGALTSLQSLLFSEIEAPPLWIGDCVSLKELNIWDCRGVSFLESIQLLTKLESLSVQRCPGLRKWIEVTENKNKIGHVKMIVVDGTELHDHDHTERAPDASPEFRASSATPFLHCLSGVLGRRQRLDSDELVPECQD